MCGALADVRFTLESATIAQHMPSADRRGPLAPETMP